MPNGLDAFAKGGRFHKGNLHTHSTRSDGARDPADVCAFYRDAGYDFLCLSDHFLSRYGWPVTDTRPHRTNRFTTILGAEVHAGRNSQGEVWHILAVGLPDDFAPTERGETGEALAARANAGGAFVGIAHPQWSSLTLEDGRAMAPHAHAVELYNTSSAFETARGDGVAFHDMLLNDGHTHLTGYATDDAHFKIADHGRAWIMVKADTSEADVLVEAMREGLSYSSTGPSLHAVALDGDDLVVEASEVGFMAAVGRGSRVATANAGAYGANFSAARLSTAPFRGDWCRVVAVAHDGSTAWTNPIFL
ncbi:CehA/McbA family metallohydrolase [Acuticoccus sp.]|uniref:CehA/McbA family metallohydrolase n=1 Tax=Acuticoccus sp. TaxID=1904378 RepID=UPI003B518F36